jgi:translation initiation factor eIF-2B subunit beta
VCFDIFWGLFDLQSPSAIADYSVVSAAMNGSQDPSSNKGVYTHVPNPTLDYVPPELISLFITDTGGHTPSYVYRLLAEYYTREDYGLST